jgi:chlorite dismutase
MDQNPYHHYIFFEVAPDFYQSAPPLQRQAKQEFAALIEKSGELIITPYSTLGLKAGSTFMLWIRSESPEAVQTLLSLVHRTKLGSWLNISSTFFGIVRPSVYSGRIGKPEQVMQNFESRLPYLILYPFTKTPEWHLLDHNNRGAIMGQHIKIGLEFPQIRQCLLYSYGLDDYEFLVSYETQSLEEFQDLIIRMRATIGRTYTLSDTPIFTCIYRSASELMEWL